MCGRITIRTPEGRFRELFGLSETKVQIKLSFNVAPTQTVYGVRQANDGNRELAAFRWGLIPSWAKDAKIAYSTFNARAESVASKPAFRSAFKSRRCLVIADGFYEWRRLDAKHKQPYFIGLKSDQPFGMAGLWERWDKNGEPVESCTVITTTANEMMAELHDRMPVILRPDDYGRWLDPAERDGEKLQALLRPFASIAMHCWPVSPLVNKAGNDSPKCVEPAE